MPFYSFAKNHEDVLLWRALGHIQKGTFVDVGAYHPVEGSPTYALYRAGWRGVTIDADGQVAQRFLRVRPEDRHLLLLIGDHDVDQVAYHHWHSYDIRPASAGTTRTMRRLDTVLADLAGDPIHVLAIRLSDAADVAMTLSLATTRPWVVLIEHLRSQEFASVDAHFERLGYAKSYSDGVNAFYIAREHMERLAPSFSQPPNARDDYVAAGAMDGRALEAADAERRKLKADLVQLHSRMVAAEELAKLSRGLRPNWPRQVVVRNEVPASVTRVERQNQRTAKGPDLLTVYGHINGSYSLARVNRDYAVALDQHSVHEVRVVPVEGTPTDRLDGVPPSLRPRIEALVAKGASTSGRRIALTQHYPPLAPPDRNDINLMMFFWEESIVPSEIIAFINQTFDAVLVATQFVAKVLVDNGVVAPVRVVGHAGQFDEFLSLRNQRYSRPAKGLGDEVVFLHVSSCFARKGVDRLVEAFLSAFSADEPVRLVIKGFPNPHNEVAATIAKLRAHYPRGGAITFINQDVDDATLLTLYAKADAVVLPTRGEGLNLPAAEALAAGLPVVVTGYGGHIDFCPSDIVRYVDFSFQPSGSHLGSSGSVWADPSVADLKDALRHLYGEVRGGTVIPDHAIVQSFFEPAAFARRVDAVIEEVSRPWWPAKPASIAWISTFGVKCGIAEYSGHLIRELGARGHQIAVMCDRRFVGPGTAPLEGVVVQPAWVAGGKQPDTMEEAAAAIRQMAPEAVVVQFHPAYFDWDGILAVVESAREVNAVSTITLHNARSLTDQVLSVRETARQALSLYDRVIVHTVLDLNLMKALGIVDNVVLMPQGVFLDDGPVDAANRAEQGSVTVGCYGFFLPHKGIGALIEAVAELVQAFPNIRLKLVNAEYPAAVSRAEMDRCKGLVDELGLQDRVDWHTDFLPHDQSLSLLRACDLIVLPYEETNEASSAAARTALASRRPVVVTPIQIFEELGSAAHRLPGTDSGAIAQGLHAFLADQEVQERTLAAAAKWLERHDWRTIAGRFSHMLSALARQEERRPKDDRRPNSPVSTASM